MGGVRFAAASRPGTWAGAGAGAGPGWGQPDPLKPSMGARSRPSMASYGPVVPTPVPPSKVWQGPQDRRPDGVSGCVGRKRPKAVIRRSGACACTGVCGFTRSGVADDAALFRPTQWRGGCV
ncbi:hypothetical protein TVNIR_1949 [Thioalkalivibrio nitratireducens DSM 14787]|uniref:Uncharacterized protein n=1 Tax=Thioalkalivibrio nitratireducens (strain DSM 14787 / UNIQEM 213 / ALEN2) TaxID=1255043 RepID=L0DXB9_THIND|nr:hypothetical protein TVNIR_1949 [Thioalkalivibrio nitratireducens DSM 14787]